jgi:hypothetical protein
MRLGGFKTRVWMVFGKRKIFCLCRLSKPGSYSPQPNHFTGYAIPDEGFIYLWDKYENILGPYLNVDMK